MKDIPLEPTFVVNIVSYLEAFLRDTKIDCNDPKRTSETLRQYATDLEDTINHLKVAYFVHNIDRSGLREVDKMNESQLRDAYRHLWEQALYQDNDHLKIVLEAYDREKRCTVSMSEIMS